MLVAACGDDTPGATPDAGATLDAGFDGATPPGDAGDLDGAPPGMDAEVADGALPDLDAEVADGALPDPDAAVLDGGTPGMDAGADAGVDAGPPGCSPVACDDGVSCTEDVCSEDGRCVHLLLESACARGQYCDLTLGCVNGAVCSTDAECADSDPCTTSERCDTSFPRRCTHRILDADADRETTTACGGGDCNDANRSVSMMARQVCGSAVDADCDGLVALDDLLGTTACANDVLRGALAVCPATLVGFTSFSFATTYSDFSLDVTYCREPLRAVQTLAMCLSASTCEVSNACTLTSRDFGGAMVFISSSFTDCRAEFNAACPCAERTEACPESVNYYCDATYCESEFTGCTVSGETGAPPTFDICRDLDTDETNCGTCGNVCAADATCTRGACCRTTDLDCDGNPTSVCETDSLTSNAHCGACGNACTGGQSCVAGRCACPAGQELCGGRCEPAGAELCGGRCVATSSYRTDPMNCGACGNVCDATAEVCSFGRCTCDFFVQNCPVGERCMYRGGFTCDPEVSGSVGRGGSCERSSDCMAGLDCFNGIFAPLCQDLCSRRDGSGCPSGEVCRAFPTPLGVPPYDIGFCG